MFAAVCATVATVIGPNGLGFAFHVHHIALSTENFLGLDTNHCIPEAPHKTCCFGNALSQSVKQKTLALVIVIQILMHVVPAPNKSIFKTDWHKLTDKLICYSLDLILLLTLISMLDILFRLFFNLFEHT